jgi:hypothetical protein
MKNKKFHLVISRYNEDVSWIDEVVNENIEIFVYNKGGDINQIFPDNVNIINLDNTGRESHTYLHHIIEKYEFLPERIIFSQGHPHDHVSDNFKSSFLNFLSDNSGFKYFSKSILEMKILPDGVEESGDLNGTFWRNKHLHSSCCVSVPSNLFPDINSKKWIFGTGAIFGADRNRVEKNSIEFYLKCMKILNESSDPVNPPEGHAFERSWYLIFN